MNCLHLWLVQVPVPGIGFNPTQVFGCCHCGGSLISLHGGSFELAQDEFALPLWLRDAITFAIVNEIETQQIANG